MSKEVLVVLAEGFEEIEALSPSDLLRRAGASVTVAGLSSLTVKGSHDIRVVCDAVLDEVADRSWDAVVLPGGMPGASNLAKSATLFSVLKKADEEGRIIAAICASPAVVLGNLGFLKDRKAVCYPGMETVCPDMRFQEDRVLRDRNFITARGAGCAVEFGLEIIASLYGSQAAEKVSGSIVY